MEDWLVPGTSPAVSGEEHCLCSLHGRYQEKRTGKVLEKTNWVSLFLLQMCSSQRRMVSELFLVR